MDKTTARIDKKGMKQHKRRMFKLFLFSVMRSVLYWSVATSLMILLDNNTEILDKEFSWFIGAAMMAIYMRIELNKR